MKKVTILLTSLWMFGLLVTASVSAQEATHVYNEETSSGIWFQGNDGGEVVNPVSDDVNSSDTVAVSATDGNWQQIQFFLTFTPESGDKLFFSVHNPNGAGPGQIQFSYTGSDEWQYGADVSYDEGSTTGWVEYSIDLSDHVGNEIDQIIIMPAGDNSAATYVDNIYFSDQTMLGSTGPIYVYNEETSSGIWFQGNDGGQVANPVSDEVNSSDTVAVSATDGNWQQIQFFLTFTPESGDKLFFSLHNPNGAGPGQIQFSYSGSDDWQYGADVSYEEGSTTGWLEYSIDLSDHVGNEIDQIIMMPAGDNSAATYIDNVYFSDSTEIANPAETLEPTEKPLHVYNDTTSSGIFFQGTDGGEVVNPISDDVNSSDTVAVSATDGSWQQIQYFTTYVPESGDKMFFSVHNPNGAGPGQVQFSYTGSDDWQYGADITYDAGSETGWVEYSVDLTDHAGNEIDQVIIMPAGDNSAATYVDNIYFSDQTMLAPTGPTYVYNEETSSGIWFQGNDGGQVANPVSDEVNSSDTVAVSATDGKWQQIQFFLTFSPESGDKLFFSVHNPNAAGPGQIQFSYSGSDDWQYGADVSYEEGSTTGWVEYSIDLSDHVGNEIDQIIMMPAGDNSAATYVDNIYFSDSTEITVSTENLQNEIASFELSQNYPNPFNPSTNIRFKLESSTDVTLKVYNLLGQAVATLIDSRTMNSGTHHVTFNAGSLSSGVYFYRMEAGNMSSTKRMMLIK